MILLSRDRELEADVFASKLLVHRLKSRGLVLCVLLIFRIKEDPKQARSVDLVANTLADNFGGEDQILEDLLVYASESAGPRALLLLQTATLLFPWQNPALGNDDDGLSRELLLQLAHETGLNLVEFGEETVRDKEDDGRLPAGNVNLLGGGNEKLAQLGLDFGAARFQIRQRLCDVSLELRGLSALFLLDLVRSHLGSTIIAECSRRGVCRGNVVHWTTMWTTKVESWAMRRDVGRGMIKTGNWISGIRYAVGGRLSLGLLCE